RLSPAAGVLVQAVWFDAGGAGGWWALLGVPPFGGGGGAWGRPGAGAAGAWSGGSGGGGARVLPRGTSVWAWGRRAAVSRAGPAVHWRAFVLDWDAQRALAFAG